MAESSTPEITEGNSFIMGSILAELKELRHILEALHNGAVASGLIEAEIIEDSETL